jgi:hypothetical protein
MKNVKEYVSLTDYLSIIFDRRFAVVPYNQPVAALDLLNRFLRNETFVDLPAPTIRFGDSRVANMYEVVNPVNNQEDKGNIMPVVVLLAFVAGVVFTILVNRLWSTRKATKGGYSKIPDTIIGEDAKLSGRQHFETSTD